MENYFLCNKFVISFWGFCFPFQDEHVYRFRENYRQDSIDVAIALIIWFENQDKAYMIAICENAFF